MPLKDKLPNQLFNLAFVTMEEILGKNGLKSVLNYAKLPHYIDNYPPNTLDNEHPSIDFTRFLTGMVELIGEKGARSLMMRSGLRGFEIMLRDMPGLFALDGVEIQRGSGNGLFEEYARIMSIMVDASNQIFGEDLHKHYTTDEGWCQEIGPCYWCTGLKTEGPICHGEVGFELGIARWILGENASVEETHCIARGDPMCRFLTRRPER
jgi:hypothetical protein